MQKIKSVCVYCGTSERTGQVYRDAAIELGKALANAQMRLIYGGSHLGLMGLVADAMIDAGGKVVGFTTRYLEKFEGVHNGLSELHIVDSMHARKLNMSESADAFIILPGGFGTLDELFEVLTWRQLEIHNKPIIVINVNEYWNPLVALIHRVVHEKFAKEQDNNLVTFVSSIQDAVSLLR